MNGIISYEYNFENILNKLRHGIYTWIMFIRLKCDMMNQYTHGGPSMN